jgi:importin-7
MRIMGEANFESDDFNIDDAEDKTMAAMGVLKTLSSLVLAVESSTELILELEIVIMPAVKFILEHAVLDLFEEAFEILGTTLFCAKQVSPTMWSLFPLIYQTFKQDGIEYLEEMLPSLDNYIAYGKNAFIQDVQIQGMITDIISTIFGDEHSSEADRIRACQLMESLMLNLRGHIDQVILFYKAHPHLYGAGDQISEFRKDQDNCIPSALY